MNVYCYVKNPKTKNELSGLFSQVGENSLKSIDQLEKDSIETNSSNIKVIIERENFSAFTDYIQNSELKSKFEIFVIQNDNQPIDLNNKREIKEKIESVKVLDQNLNLIKKFNQFFELFPEYFTTLNKPDILVPIDPNYLNSFEESPFDVFLKLSDHKYVKIINANEVGAVKETISKYENKNIETYYIKFSMLQKLKTIATKEKLTQRNDETNQSFHLRVADSALKVARDFGISEPVLDDVFATFDGISKDFNDTQKLKNFLLDINKLEATELGKHCYLTSIFVTLIGRRVKWFTQEVRKNLFVSSILHDLELFELDYGDSEFSSLSDIQNFTPERYSQVKNHPAALAKKLSKLDIISSDIIHIIEKHHEGAGNLSYPVGLNGPQLSPPSALFNVAHMFSIFLQNHDYDYDQIDKAIGELKMFYSSTTFKPYIEILEAEIK